MKNFFFSLPFFSAALFVATLGCQAQPQAPIVGHIYLQAEWKELVYLIQPRNFSEISADYLGQVIDSAFISSDGSFAFSHGPSGVEKVLLQLVVQKKGNRFSNHLMDSIPKEANYMPFVFSPGAPIEIVSEIASFQKSFTFIQPSEENRSLISLRDIRFSSFELYSAATAKGSKEESSLLEADERYQRYIKSMIDFADTTGSIETAMVAIRWISPSGDFERLPEFVHDQCEKWHHERPDHAFTNQLCQVADKNKLPVLVGDRMPDYPLPMTNGDTLLVSQLLGKRITLIDIWASWCAPCRKENRVVLVPLWAEYKDRGLQIIGYSIDNDAVSWRAAIAKDEASWKNASHLTGDDTPFLNTLRITTIPANFILDAKGKIIAKNLYGEALTTFVEEYLK